MAPRIAKSLGKLRSQVNAQWPGRSKLSDGWIGNAAHLKLGKKSDHNPNFKDGPDEVVTAFDITHDPKRPGMKGNDVRYLQKLLDVTIDGDFGDETEKAVKKVQTANKLFADGIVGAYTWAALAK